MAGHPRVLVLGSVARSIMLVPSTAEPGAYVQSEGWVGAPLIRDMIRHALVEIGDTPEPECVAEERRQFEALAAVVRPDPPDSRAFRVQDNAVGITTVFRHARKSSDPKDRESVVRVAAHYTAFPADKGATRTALNEYMKRAIAAARNPDMLVLFDFDPIARSAVAANAAALRNGAGRRTTIVGIAGETGVESLDWLRKLTPRVTGGRDRTVAIVRAEELRKAGLIVIESGPIERTVRDLFRYFDHAPLSTLAERAGHLVILFEEVGAVYVDLRAPKGTIHLAPNIDWIAHENKTVFGRTPGRMSITVAAVARQLAAVRAGQKLPDLSAAVRLSIAAFNRYFVDGYAPDAPLDTLAFTLSARNRKRLRELVEGGTSGKADKRYMLATLRFPMARRALGAWTRLDNVPLGRAAAAQRLRLIVLNGPEHAFRRKLDASSHPWFPQPRIACPYMQVGELKTVDEEEIAGFTSLTKLFRKYLSTPSWKVPLSIAVFGPPGTGKSFGVRELMKSINPAAEKELTFNLSQLTSIEALNDAFRDVQHRVLSSEEVPLVFFDEFDATFDGDRLGWLKHFLAPMQDGVFRGKATDYRIGKAFFVFAGGTSASFADFKNLAKGRRGGDELRAAKLPDFVSRLQGFLDIQSINPPADARQDSPRKQLQRKIKRALLLRSLLLVHAKPIVFKQGDEDVPNIDEWLVDAFLNAERYEHGLRSMESVVRMSKWIDGRFTPASLPAKALLEMHVRGLIVEGPAGPVKLC